MTTISSALDVSRSHLYERLAAPTGKSKEKRQRKSRSDDVWLLPMIRNILSWRPTYGYRRITTLICRERVFIGKARVNAKRIYRIMRENNLLLERYTARQTKSHDGKAITLRSNMRWCSDGFRIQCWNGDRLEIVFSLDCHDREAIRWIASSKGIDGQTVRDLMTETVDARFPKMQILPHRVQSLSDNGPGYTTEETVSFGRLIGLEICTTAPYSPESKGMAEAFVKIFKRDYVAFGDLSPAPRVLEQLPGWFEDYNENAPHKGLAMKSRRAYLRSYQHAWRRMSVFTGSTPARTIN